MATAIWRRIAASGATALLALATVAGAASASELTATSTTTLCGPVGGPVFRFGLIDPVPVEVVSVSAIGLSAEDFDLATLAVFELAWVAGTDVCVEIDELGQALGAEAQVSACGEILGGATTWLFQTGSGALDPNGLSDTRRGFIHDTLLGFVFLDHTSDPAPPNILTAIVVAVSRPTGQDCIDAAVSWHAPEPPQLSARVATLGCMVTDRIDDRTVTFMHPVELSTYVFSLTPGSSVAAGFEPGLVTGFSGSAERGLDGPVALDPIALDWCEAGIHAGTDIEPGADPEPVTDDGPTAAPQAPPSPSPAPTVRPTPLPTSLPAPTHTTADEVQSSASPRPAMAVAGGQRSAGPSDGTPTADRRGSAFGLPLVIVGLLVAGTAAAVVWWRVAIVRRPRRATADGRDPWINDDELFRPVDDDEWPTPYGSER